MNSKNKHSHPFIMVLSVSLLLIIFGFFHTEINVFGYQAKKIAPLADLALKGTARIVPLPKEIVTDSIKRKDSTGLALRAADVSNIIDPLNDSTTALSHFFKALNEVKKQKRKVRIAYFGDSMIEGDLISQDVRGCFQDTFGGNGVGFVPVTSIVAGFRTSIIHSFDGWTTYNLLEKMPSNHSLGISGYDFVPAVINNVDTNSSSSECWVKYAGVKRKHDDKFCQTKLLYGKSEKDNYVFINGKHYPLEGKNNVNQLMINNSKDCQYINAKFQCKTPVDVFGFSMESDSGVFVDNFSFRGNSGMPLAKVSQSIYAETNNCLGYDLIILQYGLNVVSDKVTDYSWYQHAMNNVIKHLQASFPNTSILLISVGDKGYSNEGVFETDPGVPYLVGTQKQLAEKNKIAFWSLYDAMGGYGSMVKWVQCDTPSANRDYAHLNFRGAHKVGKLLYEKLMSEYRDYNKKENQKLN